MGANGSSSIKTPSTEGGIPLLEARDITKAFGDLYANDHVNLSIMPGEIHALLGENGAGKSTLVKMMYGVLNPTSGQLFWEGEPVDIASPAHARALGIGMVFQHFSLFEALTVAENISLALPGDRTVVDIAGEVAEVSASYGLPLEPDREVHTLSVGERQRIEIVRCLLQHPRLLVMDEPTSVLTPQEADKLFLTLERLSGEGVAILYISHRLEEVKRLCSAATILRMGKNVGDCDPRNETPASLARMMVGEEIAEIKPSNRAIGTVRFQVENLTRKADDMFGVDLDNVSLAVHSGQILGIAGIAGNGQDELFALLSGEQKAPKSALIEIDEQTVTNMDINERRNLGAAFVPEERMGHGAVPHLILSENTLLSTHAIGIHVSSGMVDRKKTGAFSTKVVERFDVRVPRPDPVAGNLSGGNLQKFMVGREISLNPGVLIINQPTWGVDAGAAATIRQAIIDLASNGSAIIIISQDLDEIFEICDSVSVISDGTLSPPVPIDKSDYEGIGLLMGGMGNSESSKGGDSHAH
ncbi:MAG: ABC transporter ATP-binding protein [Rhizobiales bacterium]|nr:ABC transporter ATP-binding protein [Hyphomicrobiales bacterium]